MALQISLSGFPFIFLGFSPDILHLLSMRFFWLLLLQPYFFFTLYFSYVFHCLNRFSSTRLTFILSLDLSWIFFSMCVCVLSHVWLCNPLDCSLSSSSVHGISQARILEWFTISFSRLPDPGIKPMSPVLAGRFLTTAPPRKPILFYGLSFTRYW